MPRAKALNKAGVTAEPLTCTSPVAIAGRIWGAALKPTSSTSSPSSVIAFLLSDEDAGIGDRVDGAELDRHARIERRGLRRGGRGGIGQRSQEEAHDEGRNDGPKRHGGAPWRVLQLGAWQA